MGLSLLNRRILVFATPGKLLESVFIDTRSGIPRSELFKMAYGNETALYVYVGTSSDGFNWTAGPRVALLAVLLADTQVVMLNTHDNDVPYVIYGRKHETDFGNTTKDCPGGTPSIRSVIVTVLNDSVYGSWSKPIVAFPLGSPDPLQCLDNYNPGTLYSNGVYFLFPSTFSHWSKAD